MAEEPREHRGRSVENRPDRWPEASLAVRPVADGVEDAVLRTENWLRDRGSLVGACSIVVIVLCLGWWLVTPSASTNPIEDLIPTVGQEPTAPAGAVAARADSVPDSTIEHRSFGTGPSPSEGDDGVGVGLPDEPPAQLVVHVVGAVRRPGVVSVRQGARIGDAIEAVGGANEHGAVDLLNLAEPLVDGMQIRVPTGDERRPGSAASTIPLVRRPATGSSIEPDVGVPAPVDLNRAGPTELQRLPGIGPTLAEAIVAWRDEHGLFATVDDLERIPGIGPVKLAGLRDVATV